MLELQYLLLACWLFGITKKRAIASNRTTPCIPWRSFEPNFPVSFSKKKRILQRGTLTIFLIGRFIRAGNMHRNFEWRVFEHIFHRLFTGPGHNSVSQLLCRPRINLRMRPTIVSAGNQYTCYFTLIHPVLPIVATIQRDRVGKYVRLMFLSLNIKTVAHTEIIRPNTVNKTMAFHQTHAFLAIACGRSSDHVTIFQLTANRTVQTVQVLIGHKHSVTAISFCKADSQQRIKIATGDEEGTIKIWLMHSAECVRTFNSPFQSSLFSQNAVSSIDWLNDVTLATIHYNDHINVIECYGGVVLGGVKSFKPKDPAMQCIKFHPNGSFFATCSSIFGEVKLWDSSSFVCKFTFNCPSSAFSMQFNELGNLLIVGCTKEICVLEVFPNGDGLILLAKQAPHRRFVDSVAIQLTDDYRVVCLSGDKTGNVASSDV
jgi:hypothetical protein